MPYADIRKTRECQRRWYQKNKEREQARHKEYKQKVWDWFKEYKSRLACSMCGEDHPATLVFHHKEGRGKEDVHVSKLVRSGYSQARIEAEMVKCEVLCANCHRKVHSGMKS